MCLTSGRPWRLSAGSHPRHEPVHEPLASLAGLYCVDSYNLAGEAVSHLSKDGCSPLYVKLPTLPDGIHRNIMRAQLAKAVFPVLNICKQLPQLQLPHLWRVGQLVPPVFLQEPLPCGDIMPPVWQSLGRVGILCLAL